MNERTMVILGTFALCLVSSAIVTYEQIQIGNLQGKLRHMRILMRAGVRTPPPAAGGNKASGPSSFESDTVSAAMRVQDYGSVLPPMISQGHALRLASPARVHFIAYHLVVLDLQNEKGQNLPVLFDVEDPETVASWRYLYSFAPP